MWSLEEEQTQEWVPGTRAREEITGKKTRGRKGRREGADEEEMESLTANYAGSFIVFITCALVQLHLIHISV